MTLIVSSEISRGAGGVWGIALLSAGGIGSCQTYSPAANDQGSVTEVIDGQSTSTPSGADYTVARTTTTGLASITNSGTDNIITIRKLNQAEAQSSVAKLRNIDKWNWIRMHRFDRRCFAANEGSFICVA